MKISVIIPVLNEADNLGAAIRAIGGRAHEVVVVDGGSADASVRAARALGARVLGTQRGRGLQMDAGAAVATGDALLFLHADTLLPPGWDESVRGALARPGTVAGAFRLSIASGRPWFRLVERAVLLRCLLLGLVYGDQALFVGRDAFMAAGGFDKLPLMEDVDCVKRLRCAGRVVLVKERVSTSARRWERRGALAGSLRNIVLLCLYRLGVSPRRLYGWYYGA
ncbi:MAG: TIGR04283 family arsenosugar biosynthesis glycosyltransferase [Thermodesulfobacteriota bacterium]